MASIRSDKYISSSASVRKFSSTCLLAGMLIIFALASGKHNWCEARAFSELTQLSGVTDNQDTLKADSICRGIALSQGFEYAVDLGCRNIADMLMFVRDSEILAREVKIPQLIDSIESDRLKKALSPKHTPRFGKK